MPAKIAPPSGSIRYRYEAVTKEVERYLSERAPKGMRKRLESACNMDHSQFSHRMSGYRGERFSIEQFGAICHEANGPSGWPFVKWEIGEAMDAVHAAIAKQREAG